MNFSSNKYKHMLQIDGDADSFVIINQDMLNN